MAEIKLNKKEEKELFFKAVLGSPFFNIFASVLATFMVGAVFLKFGGGVPINVTQTSITETKTFDMSGEGKVMVVPDVAIVRLGIEKSGYHLQKLQDEVNRQLGSLGKELKDLKILKEDIQTTYYDIYPDYNDKKKYHVSVGVRIKVKDLAKVGEVMALVGKLGFDDVSGPNFQLSDEKREEAMKQARKMAVEEAKTKAKELAGLVGMKLGKIVNVKEGVSGGGYREPIMPIDSLEEDNNEVNLNPGTNEVRVTMTVSWEVE